MSENESHALVIENHGIKVTMFNPISKNYVMPPRLKKVIDYHNDPNPNKIPIEEQLAELDKAERDASNSWCCLF
jgi:hypothetical protein